MGFSQLVKAGEKLLADNATAILTGVGVVGTVTTAILAAKGSFKASEMLQQYYEDESVKAEEPLVAANFTVSSKAKIVWPAYLPAAGAGTVTITAIIFANHISSKRMAALAAAYGLSEKAFHEYKEKTLQHLGIKKETALKDDIAQDRVNLNPLNGQTIIIGDGEVLCYDAPTGRYFKSNMERIRKAENTVNKEIIDQHAASLSSFYEEIGLPCTSYSDDVGWNVDNLIDVMYSSVLADNGQPCIVIDFRVAPVTGYGRIY